MQEYKRNYLLLEIWDKHHIIETRKEMPTVCRFLGIVIRMNNKPKEHNPPHIHVFTGGYRAIVSILTGDILSGEIPNNKRRLVKEFVVSYKKDLLKMWNDQKIYEINY